MKKKNEISEALYTRLRSTGVQPARLYGLAKLRKQGTPLRPVLSLSGSSYDHLNITLEKNFYKSEGGKHRNEHSNWQGDLGENRIGL